MNIRVGKYALHSDQYCMWITEAYTTGKGKQVGKEQERNVTGYCTSLEKLISSFVERTLKTSDAENLEGVLNALRDAQEACEALLIEVINKSGGRVNE